MSRARPEKKLQIPTMLIYSLSIRQKKIEKINFVAK